jgi:hypothetical protein
MPAALGAIGTRSRVFDSERSGESTALIDRALGIEL